MTLRKVTCTIISFVENGSDCPVVVSEDALLVTFAASRIARGEQNSLDFFQPLRPFREIRRRPSLVLGENNLEA